MDDHIYFAVTGDIIESKNLLDRKTIQKKLINLCEEVNRVFENYIVVKFSVIVGDEFQGLLTKQSPIFEIVDHFEMNLYPVRLRFGIGEGKISTSFYETTAFMDGECFINSREGIQKAKKEKRFLKIILKDKKMENVVDIISLWIEKTKTEWDATIYRRFYLYKKLGSINKVANVEKVSRQSIGKSLKRAKYDLILKSEKVINEILST